MPPVATATGKRTQLRTAPTIKPTAPQPDVQLTHDEQRELLVIEICERGYTRKQAAEVIRLLEATVANDGAPIAIAGKRWNRIHDVLSDIMPDDTPPAPGSVHEKLNTFCGVAEGETLMHGFDDGVCQTCVQVVPV